VDLREEEPHAGAWRILSLAALARHLLDSGPRGRPAIVGIDGRSSSGKTTLASRLAGAVERSFVVHTDDIAWHESMFAWSDLLIDGVLKPVRAGAAVRLRPPAWTVRGRPGSIDVEPDVELMIVEGVGVGRGAIAPLLDVLIWVRCDETVIARREAERVRAGEVSADVQASWRQEELPFLAAEAPWRRADIVAAGMQVLEHDPRDEVVVVFTRAG
jgi:hypothetical protein